MELRISDGERSRYTEIYGNDPLARDGWLTKDASIFRVLVKW